MVDVPWPSSTNPGSAPGEGNGRLVNSYAYKDGGALRWRPLPGLKPFGAILSGELRGAIVSNGLVYAVIGQQVQRIAPDGSTFTLEQQVGGDGPVTIARNNATTPVVTITSSSGNYVLAGDVIRPYPDPDLPLTNSVAFLDGYFLWTDPVGNIYASALNDTTVDPLSIARAEARPDGALRGIVYGQQYFVFGTQTIEVWQDAGTQPFPLSRVTVIPMGMIEQWAIAGYEDGWAGPILFVANDNAVYSLSSYTPTRVSSEDLERLISRVADKRSLRAKVYTFGGNAIWSLSSDDWTWEYNVTTGAWHERESYGETLWRAGPTISAFGRWLTADEDGTLYAIDTDTRAEGDDPLIWGADSGPVKQFPSRLQVPGAAFDFVLGQAALGKTADVMLSWSHDGGNRWANPVTRSLSVQGKTFGRVQVRRLGLSTHHGIRLRFRVSDPAYTSFAGARMDVVDRK